MGNSGREAEGLMVMVVGVERGEGELQEHRIAGKVEAVKRSDLGYEQGGLIAELRVDEGERVEAGDRLAMLDTERLQARCKELDAALQEAEAALRLAELTAERVESAYAVQAISAQQRDETRQEAAMRRAVVDRIRAQRETVLLDIRKAALVAPFAGIVAARYVDVGAVVAAGQPIVRLLGTGMLEVRVGLPVRIAERMLEGDAVRMEVGGREVAGVVRGILPEREVTSRAVPVRVGLPEEATHGVRPGDLVRIVVEEPGPAEGLQIPRTALAEGARGTWACFVVTADEAGGHRAERRAVEVLAIEGDDVRVRGAIQAGDRVISDGLHRVAAGQRVKIWPGAAP